MRLTLLSLLPLAIVAVRGVPAPEPADDTVAVLVAARDLYPGVVIDEQDLYAVQLPPRHVPDGAFVSPVHVVGRIPHERILAGELVRAERLGDPERGVGLGALVLRGMRAISVHFAAGAALSGFLRCGSYVDVLVTRQIDGSRPMADRVLEAVPVLSVRAEDGGRPSVVLLVAPDDAERLAHAEGTGEIVLTLRSDLDVGFQALSGVDVLDKLCHPGEAGPIRPLRPAGPQRCYEMTLIIGGEKRILRVDDEGIPCEPSPTGLRR